MSADEGGPIVHLVHRNGAVWCGYSVTERGVVSTQDAAAATCEDCQVIAIAFEGATE